MRMSVGNYISSQPNDMLILIKWRKQDFTDIITVNGNFDIKRGCVDGTSKYTNRESKIVHLEV